MSALTDEILKGGNPPPEGFFAEFLIDGTSESIEGKLREAGWDQKSPRASIILHYEAKEVRHVQLIISGKKDIGRTMATTLWGGEHHKDSYTKFESVDLATPIFINSMTSGWVNTSINWTLKVKQESGLYRVIPRSDKQGLADNLATDLNFKIHVHLERGPKLMGKVGVAPLNNVESVIGNGRDVFPLIQLGEQFPIEFFPMETQETGMGLGVIPFFVYAGEEGDNVGELPDMRTVKSAMSSFFNDTHLVRMKKKHNTWASSYTLGNWDEVDPKYFWPSYTLNQQREEEEGKNVKIVIDIYITTHKYFSTFSTYTD